jgi:histidine transport system permease protein/arginine/ornithine transport system permease protein
MIFDFEVITENLPQFMSGVWLSVHLVVLSLLAGMVIAIPCAIARNAESPWLRQPVASFTYVFRGTPMLVQMLLIYYGLAQFEWLQAAWEANHPFWLLFREPYFCAWLAFALNTGAYTTEIIAGSMRHIPHGEIEAAQAMGMTRFTQIRRIVLPGALRRAIPAYSNEVILMLQGSAIASAITLVDITGAARNVYSRSFAPFEAFIFAGLLYMALTLCLVGLFRLAEKRWLAHLQPRRSQPART